MAYHEKAINAHARRNRSRRWVAWVPLVLVGNIVVASFAWWLVGLILIR
jgi:hypothetical protein